MINSVAKRSTAMTSCDVPIGALSCGVFGMFYDSYEDQYYYWQTIEISRRAGACTRPLFSSS